MIEALQPALCIARREVRDQMRDWRIIFPVVALTIFFPFLMNFTAERMMNFVNEYGGTLIGERLVPFLMMIVGFFPISVSLVIALESFVGEKERGSIEPLLCTPLKDWQLYLGKLLSATVPPLFGSFLGMAVYISGLVITKVPLPETKLMVLIFCLTIVQALVMVSGAVVVSTQATSIRSANLLSSFIIIPISLLIQGESVVMFWGNFSTLWWAVFGLVMLSILLVRVGLAHFQREELLGREIDVLNLRWAWGVFKTRFKGKADSIRSWYALEIRKTFTQMRLPIFLAMAIAIISLFIGIAQIKSFNIPLDETGLSKINENIDEIIQSFPIGTLAPVISIFWQNLRVILLAFVLGCFSFGILGAIPLFASLGVVGYLMSLLSANGISSLNYLVGFILPHGIFEIPAAVIATAAVLKAGAALAKPDPDNTIGEVWIKAAADWAKIMVGIVIPMLIIAACIEAWLTPRIAAWVFSILG